MIENKIIYVDNIEEYRVIINILKNKYDIEDIIDNEPGYYQFTIDNTDELDPVTIFLDKYNKITWCNNCENCFRGNSCDKIYSIKYKIKYIDFLKEIRSNKLKRIL